MCLLLTATFILPGCVGTPKRETRAQQVDFEQPQYHWGDSSGQTIVIWGDENELDRPYMKKAFERYQKLTGNVIRLVGLTKQEIEQRVPKVFSSDAIDKPDVLLSYGGNNIAQLHPDENFYDFTNAPWVDDLTGTAINQTIYNGKVIGLPHWEASISGTLYNEEIFQKYGLTVPRTQTEFLAVCEKLRENGVTPLYLPYKAITMLLYQFPMDSIIRDAETLASLNSGTLSYSGIPEMKKVVEWYKMMSGSGYFGNDYTGNSWAGMNEAMKSGKYAMMICWDTWLYTDFDGDASKFGLMPAFMGIPETGSFGGPNLALLIVNKKSSKLDAALNFINFMADPYNYNVAFEGIYTAPVFKNQVGSIATPQYIEAERLIDKHFYDSAAWLRLKGFAQMDATYIQRHMQEETYSAEDCLRDMDAARKARMSAINMMSD